MTRFARAKGSKASNEKAPENSTPWALMKNQLENAKKQGEEAKKQKEAENQRLENYNNFLKQRKVEKRNSTWFEFPESSKKPKLDSGSSNELNMNKLDNKKKSQKTNVSVNVVPDKNHSEKKNKINTVKDLTENQKQAFNQTAEGFKEVKKKTKKKQKTNNDEVTSNNMSSNHKVPDIQDNENVVQKSSTNVAVVKNEIKSNKKSKKSFEAKQYSTKSTGGNNYCKQGNIEITHIPKKKSKFNTKKDKSQRNSVPIRRKPDDKSFQLIINGKEISLVRYDGFPIMQKDAERLDDLKRSMYEKGIPKTEVQRTLKLERRRAEKALARLKKDVCYNCRKGGHNLSDCPDLKSKIPNEGEMADGVCFKCGSTEHRQFECKVQRKQEFTFASCFICKEKGHIARQCPDNPKGLYPNGGGCKLCGDVTHLRKDCPTVQDKREEASFRLETLAQGDNLEGIDNLNMDNKVEEVKKPKKIRF